MSGKKSHPTLYFDELNPEKLYSIADLKREYELLLSVIPSDARSFEEFLFDASSRHGGTLRKYHGSVTLHY